MTRGKWVALAVGVAVIAVLVPYGPALWQWVAYVERREPAFAQRENPNLAAPSGYIAFRRKRFDWLPGPFHFVLCVRCVESDHSMCHEKMRGTRGMWTCSCPHPSHREDSK